MQHGGSCLVLKLCTVSTVRYPNTFMLDMTMTTLATASQVLDFWFVRSSPKQWFGKDPAFDQAMLTEFADTQVAAHQGELWTWRDTPQGRLAEVIVLDQFSRNLYRHDARQFASDPMALALAQEAIRVGDDQHLSQTERLFLYMPFMHSESRLIHQQAVQLFTALGLPDNLDYEYRHQAIIERFGRYPHRNAILGRESTPEELAFLQQPNSSF